MSSRQPGTPLYTAWTKQRQLKKLLAVALLLFVVLAVWLWPKHSSSPLAPHAQTTPATGILPRGTPNYPTISPDKRRMDWTRVSPPDHNAVFAYSDTVHGVPVTVSEQPIPSEFQNNTDTKLEELAGNYNANRYITVDGSRVFVGNSTRGPQSLIFTKKSLLILIKSSASLSDSQWTTYIRSLN